ncbi:N-formylglutamate amidohydrolase [Patescibacteria group bacterium]|nr:N-formylglutamate amidohydrolase [Patescibacteria group bacterium]
MQKLVLHIPHSSTGIPINDGYIASKGDVDKEILKLTDWYTDDLFQHAKAIPVIAPFSRIFCDVERYPDDSDEVMAKVGMGMVYERLDSGKPLRVINETLRQEIYNRFYKVHHRHLSSAIEEQLKDYGKCVIIDCHSFLNNPFKRDLDQKTPRPQIDIGTDNFHTSKKLCERSLKFFQSRWFSCELNRPYSGCMVPHEYSTNKRVESIMIEVNRDLYLEKGTNTKSKDYDSTKKLLNEFLEEIWSNYLIL